MSAKVNEKFLLDEDTKKKILWDNFKEVLSPDGGYHSFGTVWSDGKINYLNGQACTGQITNLGRKDKDNICYISRPQRASDDHKEYLTNFLFNPEVSPYRFLMNPEEFKVETDSKGFIKSWIYLNTKMYLGAVTGLSILERIFTQHGSTFNPFWPLWKKSGLPFEAFFYLTHSNYGGIRFDRVPNWNPRLPYSTFNMFINNSNLYSTGLQGFSAPRLFQGKPNLKLAKEIGNKHNRYPTVGNPTVSQCWSNSLWDSKAEESDRKLTIEFEKELQELCKKRRIVFKDNWNSTINEELSWLPKGELNFDYRSKPTLCNNYNTQVVEEIIDLLKKYTPKFLEEKIVD